LGEKYKEREKQFPDSWVSVKLVKNAEKEDYLVEHVFASMNKFK
jgi:hypothetical protein